MDERIERAERQIAAILAQLEVDTGTLVESIEIHSIDRTTVSDTRKMLLRRVVLDCKPIPGSLWEK